ncbi:hypothetical protein HZB93_02580 [Candidatus Falkowbacteria bacterium]|nr:hypothetical protein [Candidatus Falkowbacteria bacterium]
MAERKTSMSDGFGVHGGDTKEGERKKELTPGWVDAWINRLLDKIADEPIHVHDQDSLKYFEKEIMKILDEIVEAEKCYDFLRGDVDAIIETVMKGKTGKYDRSGYSKTGWTSKEDIEAMWQRIVDSMPMQHLRSMSLGSEEKK